MKMQLAGASVHCRRRLVGLALILIATVVCSVQPAWAQTEPDAAAKSKIYLAVIGFEPTVASATTCQTTQQAQEFVALMRSDENQQRAALTCNQKLADVAQARAQDMANRNYFGHVNPDGYGPNYLVRSAGYALPTFYNQANDANNIESIAAGYASVTEAWDALKNSNGHRRHLLGEEQFYAEQIEYGIGYVYVAGSTYQHYWVIITAKQASATE